jgi:cell division protein FtsX
MILSMPTDLPLLYDRNRRTFMLVLSVLIGLLYFAGITSNGLRGFISAWQFNPKQEYYILVPYSGNAAKLKVDSQKIEEFLEKSPLIDGFRKIDEQSFQRMFNQQNSASKAWIESIPFPVFLELNLKSAYHANIKKLEEQITEIVADAQVYTQPRYSTEFVTSFKVLVYILDTVIVCLITVFLAVMVLMTRALFALQEKNIERLSLLGATPAYIKKLYCWFMARCIILSSIYGFLGACLASWAIFMATEQINFFPYGFAVPSILLYLLLPYSCLVVGVSITYILSSNLLKKLWTCA